MTSETNNVCTVCLLDIDRNTYNTLQIQLDANLAAKIEGRKITIGPLYNEDGAVLTCGHIFHKACVEPWLNAHNNCPICRQVIPVPLSTKIDQYKQEIQESHSRAMEASLRTTELMLRHHSEMALRASQSYSSLAAHYQNAIGSAPRVSFPFEDLLQQRNSERRTQALSQLDDLANQFYKEMAQRSAS